MKTIRTLKVALLICVFALTSCEKFFEVQLDDQATLEEIFSNYRTTRQYLAQCYSYIPLDEEIVGSNGWVVPRSDEGMFSFTAWVYYLLYKSGNYSSATPSSITYHNYWPRLYIGISQCTIFMDNVVDLNIPDNQDMAYMKAEARFLRAFYYFSLFRQYGPVYLWYDQTPAWDIFAETIDRHTVEENIQFIVDELDLAAEDLPASSSGYGNDVGRVTKGAAMALKARVLLYAASPLYNGCDLYKGQMKNMRGDYLFPQTPNPEKWETAAKAAKDVIDLNVYKLYENTSETDDFRRAAASYQGVIFEAWNTETIWGWWWRSSDAYRWAGGAGGSLITALPKIGSILYGYGGVAPSLKLADTYPMWESGRYPVTGYQGQNDLSRPIIDAESGYSATGFTENYSQPLVDDWATPIKAHNSCVGRDPRFYASMVPNGFWWPNRTMKLKFTCYDNAECTLRWTSAGDVIRVGYAWRRLVKNDQPFATGDDYTSLKYVYPAFRMAEIYLNYAEACNEKPQRDSGEAIEYLNKVRNRVGLNNIEVAYPGIAGDKELLRWCIQKERMAEFGMEAMRHYDACRWMIAKDEYPGKNYTLKLTSTTYEESYLRTSEELLTTQPSVFGNRDYLFPISSAQLDEMINMTQNYGF